MQHTKPYERKMRSNNVEYSTSTGPYCTTHDGNMPFCMEVFYSRKIITHHFHFDKNEDESFIGYDVIIGRNLMVKLELSDEFKHQVLQWDSFTLPLKEPISVLGQTDLTSR